MTNTATTTTNMEEVKINAMEEYNVTSIDQTKMLSFLNGMTETGLKACENWLAIGTVLARIDANTNRSTRNAVIADIFKAHKWGKDEVNYSIKMAGIDDIVAWYIEAKCTRHNPRTIYTAYIEGNKTKEDKKAEKAEKAEKIENEELEGEKKYLDVAKSLTQTMKYYEKCTLDGNMTAGELLLISNELEAFSNRVKEDCQLAMKAEKVTEHKAEKVAKSA